MDNSTAYDFTSYIESMQALNEYDKRQEELSEKRKQFPRLTDNEHLVDILLSYLRAYSDMRFGQALYNLGFATHLCSTTPGSEVQRCTDIFFEEPAITLKRIKGE